MNIEKFYKICPRTFNLSMAALVFAVPAVILAAVEPSGLLAFIATVVALVILWVIMLVSAFETFVATTEVDKSRVVPSCCVTLSFMAAFGGFGWLCLAAM